MPLCHSSTGDDATHVHHVIAFGSGVNFAMRMSDLIELKTMPTVVQLLGISHAVRSADEEVPHDELANIAAKYLVVRGANEAAFESILLSMTKEKGCAHMLSGAYGTGKSHMLAIVGLLCRFKWARELFSIAHERYCALVNEVGKHKWLVTFTSLDSYSPKLPLEHIFWDETVATLKADGLSEGALELPEVMPTSRAEAVRILQRAAMALGYERMLWLIDELSMFLGAKGHSELQADASFLQFIAQHCQRSPSWLITAIQRTVDELGELEPYSLTQIKDRYVRHVLSLAHTRQLIRRNLLPPKDERLFVQVMTQWHRKLVEAFPMLDFSAEELIACYPLHPVTLACLERIAGRFLSRTRSAVDFIQSQAKEMIDGDALQLITPDAIYEHFYPDILSHPELHSYADEVIPYLDSKAEELAPERPSAIRKIARILVTFKMAGIDASVRRICHALLWDIGLGSEMNYSYMLSLLETMRINANYIDCPKREEDYGDTYAIDLGATVTEMMRRRLQAIIGTFSDEDLRVIEHALKAMSTLRFPMPQIGFGKTVAVEWHNAKFDVMLQCLDLRELTRDWMLNLQRYIASPSCACDIHALIALPIATNEQVNCAAELLSSLEDDRFRNAIAIIVPRALGRGEMIRLMENTAASMLVEDPTLRDSDIGLALYRRLREEEAVRESETARIMRNAYLNGTLFVGERKLPVSAITPSEASLEDILTAVVSASVPKVFPQFVFIAPRLPLGHSDDFRRLVNAILIGENVQTLSANVRELWRCVAIPLGITMQFLDGDAPCKGAANFIGELIASSDEPTLYEQATAVMRKSEYGLREEQCELLIAALLKRGEIIAFDRYGSPLPPHKLSSPLRKCIWALSSTPMIEEQIWNAAVSYAAAAGIPKIEGGEEMPRSAIQQLLWQRLISWKDDGMKVCERCQSELTSLMSMLQHSSAMWSASLNSIGVVGSAISAISEDAIAHEGLRSWVTILEANGIGQAELKQAWERCVQLHDALIKHGSMLRKMHSWLTHSSLRLDGELKRQAEELMEALEGGERILERLDWLIECWEKLLGGYVKRYMAHHESEHNANRFEPYLRIRQSTAFKLLNRMVQIRIPMREAVEAMRAIGAELSKRCAQPKEQLIRQLRDMPICQSCRLTLGERISLKSPEELLGELKEAADKCKARLLSSDEKRKIEEFVRRIPSSLVRERMERFLGLGIGDDEAWLEALSDDVIECINTALLPKPIAIRSLRSLNNRLFGGEMTKTQAVKAFVEWLDEPTALKPYDMVRFVKEEEEEKEKSDSQQDS